MIQLIFLNAKNIKILEFRACLYNEVATMVVPIVWVLQIVFAPHIYNLERSYWISKYFYKDKLHYNSKNSKKIKNSHGFAPQSNHHGCAQWHRLS
jgi:hypothetical protein